MLFNDIRHLNIQLPEAIQKEKMSGHFDRAREMINIMLQDSDINCGMKARLELELNNLQIIEETYTVTPERALEIMKEKIPDMTAEEIDRMTLENKLDSFYINGSIMYTETVCDTLFMSYPQYWKRSNCGDTHDYSILDELVKQVTDGTDMETHIHIRQHLKLSDDAVENGEILKIHLPFPVENEQVKNVKLLDANFEISKMPATEEKQPTIYFEEEAAKDRDFVFEYELDHKVKYINLSEIDPAVVAESDIPEELNEYLAEQEPHIHFSEYLRELTEMVAGQNKNPLIVARKIYDYVTTCVDYRFCRDYAAVDNLTEYCALERRGDCGIQSLLFITMCRIAGIPARWQSGLDAKPADVGEHDWAMFYLPGIGWRYADLSYGGSSFLRGAYDRWNFFFGNIDPYRIPINSAFQTELKPCKKHWRIDPYDNQCGEAEYEHRGITGREVEYDYEDIEIILKSI